MATDSSKLVSYQPRDYPKLGANEQQFMMEELRRISTSLSSISSVMQKLEARIAALGG